MNQWINQLLVLGSWSLVPGSWVLLFFWFTGRAYGGAPGCFNFLSVSFSFWEPFGSILAPFLSRFWSRCLIFRPLFAHFWDRSLLLFTLSFFPSFLQPCIYLSLRLFIDASLYPWFLLEYECSLSSGMFVAVLFHSALLLYFIFSTICSFLAWHLQPWPGGLRETIKSIESVYWLSFYSCINIKTF